ncbi:hypothetical protein EON65_41235 [archaeon]|nr:MAG: hypothetical protein EON65_41235 [archaeon]
MTTSPTQLLRLKQEIIQIRKLITCPICLDLLESPVSTLCDHVFCSGCLREALTHRTACPLCGQKVPKSSIQDVHGISDIITAFDQFIKTAESLEGKPATSLVPLASQLSPVLSLLPINPTSDWREGDDRNTFSPLPVDTSAATIVLDTVRHEAGCLVNVLPRTWAGINKLGGVGRVESCTELEDSLVYSIRYVLDGTRDDEVPSAFVEKYVELGRNHRRRSNVFSSPTADSAQKTSSKRAKAMTNQEKLLWSPSPECPTTNSSNTTSTSRISASTNPSMVHRGQQTTSSTSASEQAPQKVVLCTTGIDSKYQIDQKLDRLLECGDVTLSCGFTSEVTHLLVSTAARNNVMQQRTMKYMQALAKGIWIVSTRWLEDCIASNTLLPEGEYEVRGNIKAYVEHAPRRARLAQQNQISLPLVDYKVLLCDPFPLPGPAKSDLEYLVTGCGGSVLSMQDMKDSVKSAQEIDKHVRGVCHYVNM